MRGLLIGALTIALAGCQSVEQLRALAPQQTDYTICTSTVAMNPNLRQAASEEQARRGLDCSRYAGAMAAEQQQINSGISLLQAARPQPVMIPAPPPQSVICTSRPSAGGTTTVCQ